MKNLANLSPANICELGPLPAKYCNNDFIEDIIDRGNKASPMDWAGSLNQVFDELAPIVANPTGSSMERVYWHPSLVIRAIIESSVEGPSRIELINLATELGLTLYAGISAEEQLSTLTELAASHGLDGGVVKQNYDHNTLVFTKDVYSEMTACRLADNVDEDEPLLVIPICYGGFVPAIRMALQYQRLRTEADTAVYPIRLSRTKSNDMEPYLSEAEEKYISRIAKGRTIVMADDDAFGGFTLKMATDYTRKLAPRSTVIGVVNGDRRYIEDIETQGQYWESVDG